LFTTLATVQPDRALESFWLRLSRLEGQTPLAHGRVALAGLRLLPPADPSRPALATSLFSGQIHFAEGLARRRFPHNPFAHTQLGQALLRHSEDDAALIAYAEAVRRFPHDPVAVAGYGPALLEIEGPDAALPVLRAGVRAHPDHLPLHSSYTDALIQVGAFAEAAQQLEAARRINARSGLHDPKLDQLVERLGLAQAGCLPEIHRREPVAARAPCSGTPASRRGRTRPSGGCQPVPNGTPSRACGLQRRVAGAWWRTGGGPAPPMRP